MFLTLAEDPEVGIINDDVAFAVSVDVDGQSRAYVLTFKGRVQNRLTAFQLRQKVGAADRFGDFFYLDLIYSILVFYLFFNSCDFGGEKLFGVAVFSFQQTVIFPVQVQGF